MYEGIIIRSYDTGLKLAYIFVNPEIILSAASWVHVRCLHRVQYEILLDVYAREENLMVFLVKIIILFVQTFI